MIWKKLLAASNPGGERLLYAVGRDNDPSRVFVVREQRSGNLEYVGQWEDVNPNYDLWDIMVDPEGIYAYVVSSDYDALIILDVSDPTNIVETGRVSDATYLNRLYQLWADFENDIVFVKGNEYLASIDVSNKAAPVKLYHVYETDAQTLGVDAGRNIAFTTRYSATERVRSFDISSPSFIVTLATDSSATYYDQVSDFAIDTTDMVLALIPLGGAVTFTSYDASGALNHRSTYDSHTTGTNVRGVGLDPERKIAFLTAQDTIGWWGILQVDYSDPDNPTDLRFDRYEDLGVTGSPSLIHYEPEWSRLILPKDSGFQTLDAKNENALSYLGAFSNVDFHGCLRVRPAGATYK